MRKILHFTLFLVFMMSTSGALLAQGVTTATLDGNVKDKKGEALPGANIIAIHTPTGSQYATLTRSDGRFTIANARVGGPYKVTVTFVGYENLERNDVFLSLGNTTDLDITLTESGTQLEEVVVKAGKGDIINSDRTGAAININANTIQTMVPNISRGLRDFTKLSPLANTSGNGTSFAGANNRYNQFAIDGLVNNDVFGLAPSGTNGGQTGIEPVSLDAIEEFQINIAPYDVRQGGFTGGGINAVTRSGTNTVQGSIYYFGNNEGLVGKNNPNSGVNAKYPEYQDMQTGFRVGGPIIKNKLFFFVNGEITRKKTPLAFIPGTPESNITIAEADAVANTLKTIAPSYDPGSYTGIDNETNSNKFLAKLDWNINSNHKLTLRHSYTYGENFQNSRTPNALRFYNNGQYFPSTTNSTGLEINSTLGKNSNRLLIGYTTVRDDADPIGSPFPYTLVNLTGGRTIAFGSENSSVANQLDQNILSITDDFTMYKGKHTITLGTNNEFYHFYNLFVQNIYGNYAFNSLANFQSQANTVKVAPTFYNVSYSFNPDDNPSQSKGSADFNAFQLGLYGQDEIQVTNNLKVIAGLRVDLPIFPDKPEAYDQFNNSAFGAEGKTGVVPETKILWSPRIGFNFDVLGDKTLQIRGGSGLFTGRVPFVWVSNQFSNNGNLNGTYSTGNSSSNGTPLTNGITYNTNPFAQPVPGQAPIASVTPTRGVINVMSPDFKFPQVFRTNIAVDKKLPYGLTATVEAIFSKTFNNINFTNLQRQPQTTINGAGGLDTRNRYTATSSNPLNTGFTTAARIDASYDEVIKLDNTNKGYSYNFVAQLQKQFDKGFSASVSYTYGDSKDVNSGTSSVAFSNWRFTNNINGLNALPVTRSNFSMGSRVVGMVSYRKAYLDDLMSTQISFFYNGQSGQPFSYIYNGDLNNDGTANDMIFIPNDISQINLVTSGGLTPQQQYANLDEFLNVDSYLKKHRGEYAQRNAARMPFQNQIDVRILQEFAVKVGNSTNKIQLSFDILNLGNMLNKDWGKQFTISNTTFSLINYTGLVDSNPLPPPATGANATNSNVDYSSRTPIYNYTGAGQTGGKAYSASDLASRWRGQFGIRYIFN